MVKKQSASVDICIVHLDVLKIRTGDRVIGTLLINLAAMVIVKGLDGIGSVDVAGNPYCMDFDDTLALHSQDDELFSAT